MASFLFINQLILHIELILTITGWEWMTPPVVFLTQKRLFMAQPVSWITTKWNSRTYGEIMTMATAMYRNARVQARISVHCNTYRTNGIRQRVSLVDSDLPKLIPISSNDCELWRSQINECSHSFIQTTSNCLTNLFWHFLPMKPTFKSLSYIRTWWKYIIIYQTLYCYKL